MTIEQYLLIGIIVVPLLLMLSNRLRPDVAALLMAALLGIGQLAGLGMLADAGQSDQVVKAIAGFSQPVIITLIGLFIITRGLEKSGATRWVTRYILRIGGGSETRLIALFATTTALFSLFMNNLAAGALLLPSAIEASRRTGIKPSKLLIPVAYGSLLGGSATYFTTANIITSNLLTSANPPQQPLDFLAFTPTGGLIAIAGILFLALAGRRLLPDREPPAGHFHNRVTANELEDFYHLGERLWLARLLPDSPEAGKTLAQTAIGEKLGVTVTALVRGEHTLIAPPPETLLQPNDSLTLVGREDRVAQLAGQGFTITRLGEDRRVRSGDMSMLELMPAPHSRALGKSLKQIAFRSTYGLTAIALYRQNRSYRTNVADFELALGDALLVVGQANRLNALRASSDFIVLEAETGDQPIHTREAWFALAVIVAVVVSSMLGVPVFLAVLIGALVVVLSRLVPMSEAFDAIEWQAVFLIAGMYAVSLSMVQTGLAEWIGRGMIALAGPFGGLGLAAAGYLLCGLLTQVMGGQVTALVVAPIAISAAINLNVNPQAVAVATAIACSASFLTPFAHPVNVIVIAPANYRFSDFARVGWPLTILSFIMLLIGMKLFWGL